MIALEPADHQPESPCNLLADRTGEQDEELRGRPVPANSASFDVATSLHHPTPRRRRPGPTAPG